MPIGQYLNIAQKKIKYLCKNKAIYQTINYDFEKNLTFDDYENIIKKLNTSEYVKVLILNKSLDKRNIYALEIGIGKDIIIFDAGIHAREIANPLFLLKYMIDLVNSLEKNKSNLLNVKIIIIPLVNPDGYEAVLFGSQLIKNHKLPIYRYQSLINYKKYKANSNGVDINRNFPSQHSGLHYKNWIDDSVSFKPNFREEKFFGGYLLGSEPETKALIFIFNKYFKNIKIYISLHSAGRLIYSGKPNLSDKFNLNSYRLAKYISKINNYIPYDKTKEDVGHGNDGTSTDYLSELASNFKFSLKTKRLSSFSYKKPIINNITDISIITLETLEKITFDLNIIKSEYYNKKLNIVFNQIINSYII